MENKASNRYSRILEAIFTKHYRKGITEIDFERSEFSRLAEDLGIAAPKNLGFELSGDGIRITAERHYNLVRPEELSQDELDSYSTRLG